MKPYAVVDNPSLAGSPLAIATQKTSRLVTEEAIERSCRISPTTSKPSMGG